MRGAVNLTSTLSGDSLAKRRTVIQATPNECNTYGGYIEQILVKSITDAEWHRCRDHPSTLAL